MSELAFDTLDDTLHPIEPAEETADAADRRRHRRVEIACLGRYMRADKSEAPCRLIDISVGGAAVQSSDTVPEGEHVIMYFDEIGRIEGPVTRSFNGGFAIGIQATVHRREKLAAQLTWLINRDLLGAPETRRHDRAAPPVENSHLVLPNGTQVQCKVLDISISGASVFVAQPIETGTEVTLGRLRAKVVRQHDQGLGLQFIDIQNPVALRRHFG